MRLHKAFPLLGLAVFVLSQVVRGEVIPLVLAEEWTSSTGQFRFIEPRGMLSSDQLVPYGLENELSGERTFGRGDSLSEFGDSSFRFIELRCYPDRPLIPFGLEKELPPGSTVSFPPLSTAGCNSVPAGTTQTSGAVHGQGTSISSSFSSSGFPQNVQRASSSSSRSASFFSNQTTSASSSRSVTAPGHLVTSSSSSSGFRFSFQRAAVSSSASSFSSSRRSAFPCGESASSVAFSSTKPTFRLYEMRASLVGCAK